MAPQSALSIRGNQFPLTGCRKTEKMEAHIVPWSPLEWGVASQNDSAGLRSTNELLCMTQNCLLGWHSNLDMPSEAKESRRYVSGMIEGKPS